MNMKLVGLLIAVVVLLLGLVAVMMNRPPEAPAPDAVATTAPAPVQPKPNPRGGSYKKSDPGTYEWTEPGAAKK